MNEQARRFGSTGELAGIVTRPEPDAPRAMPVVIFITAGLVHKAGPHRLYAQLSRALAACGHSCVRFDLAGMGESAPRSNGGDAERATVEDVRAVMDDIAAEGTSESFVLAGLCSGAEVAHRTAVADERVCGLIALDGYILRNAKYYLHHYLPRLLSASKWRDFLRSRLARVRGEPDTAVQDEEQRALAFWDTPAPSVDALLADFNALARRNVRQLQIFSGGSGDCSYARQFQDVFRRADFGDTLTVRYNRAADHMYILSADRRSLVRSITRWMQRNFPAANRAATNRDGVRTARQTMRHVASVAADWNPEHSLRIAGRRQQE